MLTGSGSKSCRKKIYHYYHYTSSCGVRYGANKLNATIVDGFKKYLRPRPELQLYKNVVVSVFNAKTRLERNDIKQLSAQLDEVNRRLSKTRELLLTEDIDVQGYRIIKAESESNINRLEVHLTESVIDTTNIEPLWNRAISNISQLHILYTEGTVTQKRKIISSMFPEKLTFDGFQYRTTRVNEAIRLMCLMDSKVGGKKNGTSLTFSDLSQQVNPLVQNSNYLMLDLRLLCDLLAA